MIVSAKMINTTLVLGTNDNDNHGSYAAGLSRTLYMHKAKRLIVVLVLYSIYVALGH